MQTNPSTTPDRVLMVIPGDHVQGRLRLSTLMTEQAASLRKKGLCVEYYVVHDRLSWWGMRRNFRQLQEKVLAWKPDLVHAQYGTVTAYVASKGRAGIPLIVSFCGGDLQGIPIPGPRWRVRGFLGRQLGLWAARRAAALIVKSRALLESLPPRLRTKSTVLPNGVDTDFFQVLPREECRRALDWPLEEKVVLFNASSSADHKRAKNLKLAQAAIERVQGQLPDVELRTFSDATRDEVRLMMNAADCLLLTSLREGSPNVVKEALACNLPVVSVPCGDVVERLEGVTPGGVYPYDADALARGLQAVVDSNRRSNGRNVLISQGLTAAETADRLIEIYARAVSTAEGRARCARD